MAGFGEPQMLDPGPVEMGMPNLGKRTEGWLAYIEDFLANQDNAMPLVQAGLSMLQPTPAGGNAWTNVLGGVNQFVAAKQGQEDRRDAKVDRELKQRLLEAQTKNVDADTNNTTVNATRTQRRMPFEEQDLQVGTELKRIQGKSIEEGDRRADRKLTADIWRDKVEALARQRGLEIESARLEELARQFDVSNETERARMRMVAETADKDRAANSRVNSTYEERLGLSLAAISQKAEPDKPDEYHILRGLEAVQSFRGKSEAEIKAELIKTLDITNPEERIIIEDVLADSRAAREFNVLGPPAADYKNDPRYKAKVAEINANAAWSPQQKAAAIRRLNERLAAETR